jgi:small neutral amino acid transporter SnatA (MarC family)
MAERPAGRSMLIRYPAEHPTLKRVTAIIGGLFIAFIVYLVIWFFARNMVEGLGTGVEVGGHLLVVFIALAAGFSSYRASLARR